MIKNKSGQLFRFRLDHNLGSAYAELYDFTDISPSDGLLLYVYNETSETDPNTIRASGTAIGPLRLTKFPNTYGSDGWQLIDHTREPIINTMPDSKELRGYESTDDNWDKLGDWFRVNSERKQVMEGLPYHKLRHLETRDLHNMAAVATKMSMKIILDRSEKVSDYYDFRTDNFKILYVELVNTYYPLSSVKKLLKDTII